MTTKANNLFAKLENQRILLMAELSTYDDATLNKKPSPEAWSVVQVMQHLINAEAASLAYIKKKLSYTNKIPKAGLMSFLRRMSLSLLFSLPLKFKAPKGLEIFPDNADFNSLKNQWASQRLELKAFMDSIPDKMFKTALWRHAVVGKMSMTQMLSFFHEHAERHRGQIDRR
jgi:uncharacterized damage-inducible protein DinB